MNSDLATWGLFAARLAFETLLIIGSAAVASQFIRHPTMHRSLWQGLLVALAILWSVELLDLRPSRPTAGIGTSTAERSAPEVSVRQAYSPEAARSSQPSAGTPPTITDPPSPSAKTPESESESTHSVVWPGWLWIAGMSCVLGNILFKRLQLFLWIRSTRCRRDLIRSPWRIIESTELCGPVAFGIWRPTIALPAEFAERFTAPQRDAMVAHEMAHLDGRDPAWCLLSDLLCAVAWWHPGVWWVRNRFRAAAESAADTVAATMIPGGHMALAEALVTLGRDLASAPGLRGLGVLGSGFRSQLAHRVTHLLDASHADFRNAPPRLRSWLVASATLAVTGACLAMTWPPATSLGLRNALVRRGPAVVVVHDPAASTSEIRRWSPATLSSMQRDPQYRSAMTALAKTNSDPGTASPPSSKTHSEPNTAATATNRPITLEVKFAEIVERSSDDLGLDWLFGQSPTNNAPLVTGGADQLPTQEETPRGRGLRVDLLRTEGQAARLGEGQFAALMERLQSRGGIDLVATPSVTTLSGQQARIEIMEARTLVTDVDVSRMTGTNATPSVNYQTENLFVGQSVDLISELAGDEVRLKVTANVTEFLGYDEPKTPGTVQALGAAPLNYQEPLPRVRVRQTVADGIAGAQPAMARPGETIVLRGPLITEIQRQVDKVVVLGDLPLLGRLFRHATTSTVRKRLYLFITPTLQPPH
jgi:beta-lactamase regulating signal transducer with metallopeptidase domain